MNFSSSPSVMILVVVLFWISSALQTFAAPPEQAKGETIVLIRHGEKPPQGLGQLNCKGLNRALALPDLLIKRYGKPDFIYAPNPSIQVNDRSSTSYSYVRPLVTIEPTAIRLGMPVNTQIGFNETDKLQKELMQPTYAHSLIFVAWEHIALYQFARQMLLSSGKDPNVVPDWPNSDYETIYIFHVIRSGGTPHVNFTIAKEMLANSLSDSCSAIR
jgi:hypothetical protein